MSEKKRKLCILHAPSERLLATVEVDEREAQEVKRGIEKIFRRLLGCKDYVVVQEHQKGEENG